MGKEPVLDAFLHCIKWLDLDEKNWLTSYLQVQCQTIVLALISKKTFKASNYLNQKDIHDSSIYD